MKRYLLALALTVMVAPAFAQKYMTRTGRVGFFSATKMENIEGINNEVACVLDAKTGALQFVVPIKSFKFEKALMQDHFNENYMESDKYPKAEFKGSITDLSGINFARDGSYKVQATGKMTMHGVIRDVIIPGTINIKGGQVTAEANFNVTCADYGIKIPSVVSSKIAEQIKVTVNAPMSAAQVQGR
jgi:polyisoprenoid-binding protein YceI